MKYQIKIIIFLRFYLGNLNYKLMDRYNYYMILFQI